MSDDQLSSMLSDVDDLAKRVDRLEEHLIRIEKILDSLSNEQRVSFVIGDGHQLN
jgi:hypothetical protein